MSRGARGVAGCAAIALTAAIAVRCTASPAPRSPSFRTVGTLAEVMEANIATSAAVIFDAVVYTNGVLEHSPKSDEEWATVEHGAIALAESANLLLLPGRTRDAEDWVRMTHALSDAAIQARDAALRRNVDGLLDAGSVVYEACTACHAKYLIPAEEQPQRQSP